MSKSPKPWTVHDIVHCATLQAVKGQKNLFRVGGYYKFKYSYDVGFSTMNNWINSYALASCLLIYSMGSCPLCLDDEASRYDEMQ